MPFQQVLIKFMPFLLYPPISSSSVLHSLFFISQEFISLVLQHRFLFKIPIIILLKLFSQQTNLKAFLILFLKELVKDV